MAVTLTVAYEVNSQNIANNTSNITVTVRASFTGGSYNKTYKSGYVTIDGTKYTFTSPFNTGQATSGTSTLYTKTVNVTHASDGTKQDMYIYASYNTGVSSGTIAASAYVDLPTIPRKSTMSISGNQSLGVENTLTVTRMSTSFTHTIKAVCGSASTTICTKSTSTTISFTPPLSWAAQNTTGTSLSVKYTITTYNGSTSIGSNSYTRTHLIPTSIRPSCAVAVSDPTGHYDKFGAYVQNYSKIKIDVTPTEAYGAEITSYHYYVDLMVYNHSTKAASYTTTVLTNYSATVQAAVTVYDARGRSSGNAVGPTVNMIAYSSPVVNQLSVKRCNSDGTENAQGEFVQVKFSSSVRSLNDKNTASYVLEYKKTSDSDYTSVALTEYENNYFVTNGTYIFEADTGSSYNVRLSVTDYFETSTRTTTASTAFTLIHWLASGLGIAFGKIAELANVLDIGFQTRFAGGILHPVLEPETNLDDVRTPNTYVGANVTTYNYANCPLDEGTFTLDVVGMGDSGQVKQRITSCRKADARAFERIYYQSAWGEWVCVSDFAGTLLASPGMYMTEGHTVTLAENVSKQKNGIVLVFSEYTNGAVANQTFSCHFVPKLVVSKHNGVGHSFWLTTSNLAYVGTKYLYIHDDTITGHTNNDATGTTSGITYASNRFVLRYVIGV